MINDDLDFMRAEAMQEVERVLGPMMVRDPEGARAIVTLWAFMTRQPGQSVAMDAVLAHLPQDMLLGQALFSGDNELLRVLAKDGVDVALATNRPEPEDQYFKLQRGDEPGVVAQMALSQSLPEPLQLSRLAQMFPGRVACWSLPKEGNTASWLALALHTGRQKDAEKLWEEGQPFSLDERAEAAVALLTSPERESPFLQVGDESEGCF